MPQYKERIYDVDILCVIPIIRQNWMFFTLWTCFVLKATHFMPKLNVVA